MKQKIIITVLDFLQSF